MIVNKQSMKRIVLLSLFALGLCNRISAQETYNGKLVLTANPPLEEPALPGMVLALETESENYILKWNAHWIAQLPFEKDGVLYFEEDEVVVTGILEHQRDINDVIYAELAIQEIQKKKLANSGDVLMDDYVLYAEGTQVLQVRVDASYVWWLEVFDIQGRMMLSETGIGCREVNMADYPKGVYVYRLSKDGRSIASGKIVRN